MASRDDRGDGGDDGSGKTADGGAGESPGKLSRPASGEVPQKGADASDAANSEDPDGVGETSSEQPARRDQTVPELPPYKIAARRGTWERTRDFTGKLRRGEGSFFMWLRQTARLWGFLAVVLAVLLLFRSTVLPFGLAILVAYVLAPVLDFLCRLRLAGRTAPRFVWLIVMYVALAALTALFLFSFVPRVSGDLKRIVGEAPKLIAKARKQWVPGLADWLHDNFGVGGAAKGTAKGSGKGASKGTGTSKGTSSAATGALARGGSAKKKTRTDARKLLFRVLDDGSMEVDLGKLNIEVVDRGGGRYVVRAAAPRGGQQTFQQRLREVISGLLKSSEEGINALARIVQRAIVGVLSAITTLILVLMVSAFLLIDTRRILGGLKALVDTRYHADFDAMVGHINKGLSGAIRGQLLICVVNGFLTWVGLTLFSVKYAPLLALMAAVMSLIPIFGSILSTIPIVLVALASGESGVDLLRGFAMLAWIILIHLIEANLLNPKIIGSAAKIHPVIVIFAVVAGQKTYGAMGALLAVPIVSAFQSVFLYIRKRVRGAGIADAGPTGHGTPPPDKPAAD